MTLYVDVRANRKIIATAQITNTGHPKDGTHPDDDDLRFYRYSVAELHRSQRIGRVEHHRSDGAWELVRKVLEDHSTITEGDE